MAILITNNPLVEAQYKDKLNLKYIDIDLPGILTNTRDMVHKGHRLLTHPLMGSVKPNESPYKSILITEAPEKTDLESVKIIEESIQTALKFTPKVIPEQYLRDLQVVDLSLIRAALEK